MTHAELVEVAGRWLAGTRRCGVVLTERGLSEIPDAIGWSTICVVIEVKVSRVDFLADRRKPHRHPMGSALGRERWYLTPPGLLGTAEIPEPWGLLEWNGRQVRKRKQAVVLAPDDACLTRENRLLLGELRAYHSQGISYKTMTGREVVPVRFRSQRRGGPSLVLTGAGELAMGQLSGLEGVKGRLAVQQVVSIEQALRRIQQRRAVTAAGATGALNVWRDDQKRLRSHFMRYRVTLDEAEHVDLESLRRWLTRWWPELGRDDEPASSPEPKP